MQPFHSVTLSIFTRRDNDFQKGKFLQENDVSRQEWAPLGLGVGEVANQTAHLPVSWEGMSFLQHSQIDIKSFSQTQIQKKGSSAGAILTTLLAVNTCCQPEKEVVLAQSKTLYSFLISCLLSFETIGRKSRFSECEPNCNASWCHFCQTSCADNGRFIMYRQIITFAT